MLNWLKKRTTTPISQEQNSNLPSSSGESVCTSSANSDNNLIIIPLEPNQPDVACIPMQPLNGRALRFQSKWFEKYSWLHFDAEIGGVLCHVCASAYQSNQLNLTKRTDKAFLTQGFRNWKKGKEKFEAHQKSETHKIIVSNRMQIQAGKSCLALVQH